MSGWMWKIKSTLKLKHQVTLIASEASGGHVKELCCGNRSSERRPERTSSNLIVPRTFEKLCNVVINIFLSLVKFWSCDQF